MTPNEYRRKHKRCRTCIYCKEGITRYFCRVKDKSTNERMGRFCKVYKAREFKE